MRIVSFTEAGNGLTSVLDNVVNDVDYTVITRRDAPANAAHLSKSIEQFHLGQDKKTLKRINKLRSDTKCSPFEGVGKTEPLKENFSGFWCRRIDETNRLVYAVTDTLLTIIYCRYHY